MHLIDPYWILSFRTDSATAVFKWFPWLGSDYFYITVIALGFWLARRRIIFLNLGVLISLTTLLNCLLKESFKIPRPPMDLHLVAVRDLSYGFPSGDTQAATVFWGYLFVALRDYKLRWLCLLPIVGITVSRVYLGVHSVYDVTAGLGVGILTLTIWQSAAAKRCVQGWYQGRSASFWAVILIMIALYAAIVWGGQPTGVALVGIGALLGCGLSLPFVKATLEAKYGPITGAQIAFALVCLALLGATMELLPKKEPSELLLCVSTIVKYAFAILAICVIVPKIRAKVFKPN